MRVGGYEDMRISGHEDVRILRKWLVLPSICSRFEVNHVVACGNSSFRQSASYLIIAIASTF